MRACTTVRCVNTCACRHSCKLVQVAACIAYYYTVNTTPILFTLGASNESISDHKLTISLSPPPSSSLFPRLSLSLSLPLVRTSSLSTFDSIELGRYSDDLDKETDDRVAVLEFELRKAYETIKSLRGSLTEAATGVHRKSENSYCEVFSSNYM